MYQNGHLRWPGYCYVYDRKSLTRQTSSGNFQLFLKNNNPKWDTVVIEFDENGSFIAKNSYYEFQTFGTPQIRLDSCIVDLKLKQNLKDVFLNVIAH